MRKLLTAVVFVLSSVMVFAQTSISGKIIDSKTGAPISGATIKVKSSKRGTSTNNEGVFTLTANPNDVLEISIVGYQPQTVKVNGQSTISIALNQATTNLSEVVVIGSRGAPRVKTESPVPVDVIKVNQLGETTAKPDLMSQLNMSVPSFNYNKQSGADGSDAIDFASLRGLGFDQTLVLVNGKRRHLSAFVNELGTRGRGNSGTDLNAIPEASIDRIEILRDGASAQYGSDAIAGVMNIILKKDIKKFNFSIGESGYYDHKYNTLNNVDPSQYYTGSQIDGATFNVSADYGLPIGKNGGFINIGANFMNQGKTFRAVPDTNWTTNQNALSPSTWRRAFGDGSVTSGGAMYNMEIPIKGTNTKFYSFGGMNYKHSNVYAWTRNFSQSPQKFPTNADGSLIFDPNIMKTTKGGETFFNPQEDVYIKDESIAVGLNGTTKSGWDWDISNNTGYNDFHYYGNKTYNATLNNSASNLKTRFNDGGFNFLQNTANLDLSKHFDKVAQGLTLSFGGEFRFEQYKLYAGEPDSYGYGPLQRYFPNVGDTVALASGSEGFPGFQPSDASVSSRTNIGGYVDLAFDFTKDWLVDLAARFENYSDFGFVNTYKLATHYKLATNFNLRGSISTGFRAPSLQQINFSNTNTNVTKVNGVPTLVYVKLVPNYSDVARAAGIPALKQETSVNYSLGFAWKPVNNLTVTLDGYLIKMKNRIVITGNFGTDITALANVLPNNNPPLYAANFFANSVNTTNKGIDIVLDYNKHWGKKAFKALLAGNIQTVNIDNINIPSDLNIDVPHQQAFFSTREQAFLIASAPKAKFSLNLEYSVNKLAVGTHLTYFGNVTTQGYGYASLPNAPANSMGGAGVSDQGQGWDPYVALDNGSGVVPENFVHRGKVTTDLYASYKLSKQVSWTLGIDNLFNVHPDLSLTAGAHQSSWGDSESGGPFDAVQMGYDGMRLFTKFIFNF
ncbi:MAG: TonB-dependent receptor [Bacteroidetes bacterium]|nr:TonB-dependent receptor [Bacteroidota bacterium]